MHKDFIPPVSIEEFAAYLDGNLTEVGMNRIDALVSANPRLEEMITISGKIEEDVHAYMQDEFAYEADIMALENSEFDIPNIEANTNPHIGTDPQDHGEISCAIDSVGKITDIDEAEPLDYNEETMEKVFRDDNLQINQNEASTSTINENNEDDTHESLDFPFYEDF